MTHCIRLMIFFLVCCSQVDASLSTFKDSVIKKTRSVFCFSKTVENTPPNELLDFFNIPPDKPSDTLRIMTFNLRYENNRDTGERNWNNRLERVVQMIRFYQPDIIGLQEVLYCQKNDLIHNLKDYESFGEPRSGYDLGLVPSGEYNPIFYRKKRLKRLDSGTFWLNEKKAPYKKGWGATDPRISTWGSFKNKKTGKELLIFNTHLSVSSEKARLNGMELILQEAEEKSGNFQINTLIIGDMNDFTSSVTNFIAGKGFSNSRNLASIKSGPTRTYTGWKKEPVRLLDFIYIQKNESKVVQHVVIEHDTPDLTPLSDHLPVFIDVN